MGVYQAKPQYDPYPDDEPEPSLLYCFSVRNRGYRSKFRRGFSSTDDETSDTDRPRRKRRHRKRSSRSRKNRMPRRKSGHSDSEDVTPQVRAKSSKNMYSEKDRDPSLLSPPPSEFDMKSNSSGSNPREDIVDVPELLLDGPVKAKLLSPPPPAANDPAMIALQARRGRGRRSQSTTRRSSKKHKKKRSKSADRSSNRVRFGGIQREPDFAMHSPVPARAGRPMSALKSSPNRDASPDKRGTPMRRGMSASPARGRRRTLLESANFEFNPSPVEAVYNISDLVLGNGATGEVKLATLKVDKAQKFAVKIIDKDSKLIKDKGFVQEIEILSRIKHPNVIELVGVHQNPNQIFLVLQLAEGGELFDRIIEEKVFTERDARDIAAQLVDALSYLHSSGISHRDLKPDNVLFKHAAGSNHVLLADFGFAKFLNNAEQRLHATQRLGTFGYTAPEVNEGKQYDEKCDIWSLGVILYIMLCGIPPWCKIEDDKTALDKPFYEHAKTMPEVPTTPVEFPNFFWKHVSDKGKHFVSQLLELKASKRPRAIDLTTHPWLKTARRGSLTVDGRVGFGSRSRSASSMR